MRKLLVPLVALLFLGTSSAFAGWEEGVVAYNKGDHQTAVTEFQEVVEQNPDAHQGHSMLGRSLSKLKRQKEALNHFRKAYDLNPNDMTIKIELGKGYFDVRRYSEAAQLLGALSSSELAAMPAKNQSFIYQIRAVARENSGDESGALGDYKSLARLKPRDAKIQLKYGVMASANNQMSEALAALDRAAQADGSNKDVMRAQISLLKKKGRMSRDRSVKQSSYLKAANIAGKLVGVDGSYESYLLKCEVELGAKIYDKATGSCQSASSKKSSDWLAKYYLGQAFTSNNQFDEAVVPLKEAVLLASKQDDQNKVWKQLGFAYEKQKNFPESIDAYRKAGDSASAIRVEENDKTARENANIEAHNEQVEAMRKEAEELERQLQELEEEGGGGR